MDQTIKLEIFKIADNFGKDRKRELINRLEKFVFDLYNKYGLSKKVNEMEPEQVEFYKPYISYHTIDYDDKVNEIKDSSLKAYDKVMEILRLSNLYGGWHGIIIFDTVELFHHFNMMVEKNGSQIELRYNDERQEFKIK